MARKVTRIARDGKLRCLVVLNGGKQSSGVVSRDDFVSPLSGPKIVNKSGHQHPTVMRLGDVIDGGKLLRVCCGTCGHQDDVDPSDLPVVRELPVSEVRRMLACTACSSRWIDARPVAAKRSAHVAHLNTGR